MSADTPHWIAVDWGTTNLRCFAMSAGNTVLARADSDQGMAAIASGDGDFESALLDLINPWLRENQPTPVIACGMVGARQGWIEIPYESAPCSPLTPLARAPTRDPRIAVSIHAGVSQANPADVMRGEETQVAGLLATHPDFEGLVCLPGTHTKWVNVADARIQHFRTFMTGELHTLIAEHSVLQHTLSSDGWNKAAFLDALHSAMANPEDLLTQTFALRAESLLHNLDPVAAHSRLSGILLGNELAGAFKTFPGTGNIALIASPSTTALYQLTLESLNRNVTTHSAEEVTLAGLAVTKNKNLSSDS